MWTSSMSPWVSLNSAETLRTYFSTSGDSFSTNMPRPSSIFTAEPHGTDGSMDTIVSR